MTLEDGHYGDLGVVSAKHKPSLLKQYHTVACVRDIYYLDGAHDNSPYKLLPQWMEYHQEHGIDHFFVYTFNTVKDDFKRLMLPYLESGVATRIHFEDFDGYQRHRHRRLINDCLYRAKNHAQWAMMTIDVDEYFQVGHCFLKRS